MRDQIEARLKSETPDPWTGLRLQVSGLAWRFMGSHKASFKGPFKGLEVHG